MKWGVLLTLASTLLPTPQVMPVEERRLMPSESAVTPLWIVKDKHIVGSRFNSRLWFQPGRWVLTGAV